MRRQLVDVEARASRGAGDRPRRRRPGRAPSAAGARRRRRSARDGRRARARRARGRSGSRARARPPPAAGRRAAPPGSRSCDRPARARPCAAGPGRPSTRGPRRGSWRRRGAHRRDRSARGSASRKSSWAALRGFDARCSATAQARLRPSKVAVPRPISSRITRLRDVARVQDVGGLLHLDHEGGLAAGDVVGRADPREEAIDDRQLGAARRHERAGLGHQAEQRRTGAGRSTCRPCSGRSG